MKVPFSLVLLVLALGCGSSNKTSEASDDGSSSRGGTGGALGAAGLGNGGKGGSDSRGSGAGAAGRAGASTAGAATTAGTTGAAGRFGDAGSGASGAANAQVGGAPATGGSGAGGGGSVGGNIGVQDLPNRACLARTIEPEASCSGAEAVPIGNPTSLADELYNQVLESEWRALWAVIGQYSCGHAPIYRGSFGVHSGYADEEWPTAIASLLMGEGADWIGIDRPGIHLNVFDRVAGGWAMLTQQDQELTQTIFQSGSAPSVILPLPAPAAFLFSGHVPNSLHSIPSPAAKVVTSCRSRLAPRKIQLQNRASSEQARTVDRVRTGPLLVGHGYAGRIQPLASS